MKLAFFLLSLFLFLWYIWNNFLKGKRRKRETPQSKTAESANSSTIAEDFYSNRLQVLYSMLDEAREDEAREEDRVNHIKELNQFGVVIGEKNEKKANTELYRARQKRLNIENQIYHTKKASGEI